MQKKFFTSLSFLVLISIVLFSCKKINESTALGDDIIPGVDGINTFDTTITVEAYNNLFTATNDSFGISRMDGHLLGSISNDPLFGKTNAKIFLELKPNYYKWKFSEILNPDSLHFDSCVLVLGWQGTYGDTAVQQRVKVFELAQTNTFRTDSFYQVRQQYFTNGGLLGSKNFYPYELNDSVKAFKDTTINQLRIKLDNTFGRRLLTGYDTLTAYASDSAFKTYFKGFAIETDAAFGGNALMSFGLATSPNTKLAIYYRYTKNGKQDTTVSYFSYTGFAAHHNFIDRNFTGSPIMAAQGGTTPDDHLYLINAPGSYGILKIPALKNLTNRIIHRADLTMEQIYDVSDKTFISPQALYLDVFDSIRTKYKVVPYDFVPDNTGMGQQLFGMFGKNMVDASGNPIRQWKFNITRYIQNILTKKEPLHTFRLQAHQFVQNEIRLENAYNSGAFVTEFIPVNSSLGVGRVRLGGGNHSSQKMRLRIVYSKL